MNTKQLTKNGMIIHTKRRRGISELDKYHLRGFSEKMRFLNKTVTIDDFINITQENKMKKTKEKTKKQKEQDERMEYLSNNFIPDIQGFGVISKQEVQDKLEFEMTDDNWSDIEHELQHDVESYMDSLLESLIDESLDRIKSERIKRVFV